MAWSHVGAHLRNNVMASVTPTASAKRRALVYAGSRRHRTAVAITLWRQPLVTNSLFVAGAVARPENLLRRTQVAGQAAHCALVEAGLIDVDISMETADRTLLLTYVRWVARGRRGACRCGVSTLVFPLRWLAADGAFSSGENKAYNGILRLLALATAHEHSTRSPPMTPG